MPKFINVMANISAAIAWGGGQARDTQEDGNVACHLWGDGTPA